MQEIPKVVGPQVDPVPGEGDVVELWLGHLPQECKQLRNIQSDIIGLGWSQENGFA